MITLRNLSFGYQPHQPVLDGIDLEITSGHIYGLLGKNGEGKTTLLKLWSGLLFPDKGDCRVNRENPALRTVALLQQLFFLPEEISLPDVTAGEYLKMYVPFYPSFRPEILQAALDAFEVDRSARLQSLSLGQKKKVAITLALAAHTRVLLMDEPTNGLGLAFLALYRSLGDDFPGLSNDRLERNLCADAKLELYLVAGFVAFLLLYPVQETCVRALARWLGCYVGGSGKRLVPDRSIRARWGGNGGSFCRYTRLGGIGVSLDSNVYSCFVGGGYAGCFVWGLCYL